MQSLTYIEIDVDRCSNAFGEAPCAAALGVGNDASQYWNFDTNSTKGFSAVNCTLAPSSNGMTVTGAGTDQQIRSPDALSISGDYYLIVIDWERMTAGSSFEGRVYSSTASAGEGIAANKSFADLPVASRALSVIDMSTGVSGNAWTGATRLRFDFDQTGAGIVKIHSIRVCRPGVNYKCFNSLKTCVDRTHLTPQIETLRFSPSSEHYPIDIDATPNIASISFTPGTISLGEDLGQRATLTVQFKDHPHPDTGPGGDRYVGSRGYDPYRRGSFWGKFRARYPYLQGRSMRVIRGLVGQALNEMDVRHYVIDSFNGPTFSGDYTITAKDVLKLADDSKAKAPALSVGFLSADITASTTSFTVQPTGVGATYPASGYINISGSEICSFTRSGDTFTVTRAQFSTVAQSHSSQDRVQLCLRYNGVDPADIIYDLFVNYAGIDASYISLAAWKSETAAFLQRVYTALIAEPTGVNGLVSELIQQAALAIWWDDASQKLRLQVLRSIATGAATLDEDVIMRGSLSISDQSSTGLTQVWTYYGLRNPLLALDETSNYRSVEATVDLQTQSDFGSPAVKQIFSRWIPAFGRSVATRLNSIVLGRFSTPPRSFKFSLFRDMNFTPLLGQGYRLEAYTLQDATGAVANAPLQITRLNPDEGKYDIEAQEMLFVRIDASDLNNRTIIVDTNTTNFNLRSVHDSLYPPVADPTGISITVVIESGVIVGSTSVGSPAFDVGSWPADLTINVQVRGRLEGTGGKGGDYGQVGQAGGTALYTRYPIHLDVLGGEIWGGGGGGGAGVAIAVFVPQGLGGGGGAGSAPGSGGLSDPTFPSLSPGSNGTFTAGGPGAPLPTGSGISGTPGGTGGGPGLAGATANKAGGASGKAVDGISFITVTAGPGDRRGPEVN